MDRFTQDTTTAANRHNSLLAPQRQPKEDPAHQCVEMRILDLLTSRLCHELSGPIAAIANGVELLAEENAGTAPLPGPAFTRDAVMLVEDSARRAKSRLQFYRFAYGFASNSAIAGPPPHEIAIGFFADSRITTDYAESVRALSPDLQKLACNMLTVVAGSLSRGGRLVVRDAPLTVEGYGAGAGLSVEAQNALLLVTPIAALTARTVQPYFTGLLAKTLARSMEATAEPGNIRITAAPTSS